MRLSTRLGTAVSAAVLSIGIAVPAAVAGAAQPEVFGVRLEPHSDQQRLGTRGQVAIVADVAPGTVVSRELTVANATSRSLELAIYPGAAEIEDGQFVFIDDDEELPVPAWTRVSRPSITLAPDATATVHVDIVVPTDAPSGEHYGAIWVAATDEGDLTRVNRVGVRVYLGVVGGAERVVTDFVVRDITGDVGPDGARVVRASVVNTGQRALSLEGTVGLEDGPGGAAVDAVPLAGPVLVGVGEVTEVTASFRADLPLGPWRARVELASGREERAAEATITFPDGAGRAEPVPATMTPVERQRRLLIPLATTMIVTVLTILLVLVVARWRRERARDAARARSASDQAEHEPVRSSR